MSRQLFRHRLHNLHRLHTYRAYSLQQIDHLFFVIGKTDGGFFIGAAEMFQPFKIAVEGFDGVGAHAVLLNLMVNAK